MPGVKGAGGPVPKRSDQRRRRNEPRQPVRKAPPAKSSVKIPPASAQWHRGAKQWYSALRDISESMWYTSADWATAWAAAEALSRELNSPGPVTAAAMQSFLKACTALLATEGDRRRAQVEIQRSLPPPPATEEDEGSGDVSWIDDARLRLRGPQ